MQRMIPLATLAGAMTAISYRLWRIDTSPNAWLAEPANTYKDALDRLDRLRDLDSDRVNPACRTRLLTHGTRTARAVAIFHGLSNCPQQFAALATDLHAAGYNVLLPRLPRHGLERMTDDMAALTTSELVDSANEVVDIMQGLGDQVTVMGLSAGGALAAWCAQNRPDVDRAIAISPALGLATTPSWTDRIYANALGLLPNRFLWWDPELKDAAPGPPDAYPRIATRAVGALIRLGKIVQIQAKKAPPAIDNTLIVLNPNDDVVRNSTARAVAKDWRERGMDVTLFELPATWQLPHDLIDPGQTEQRIDIVYPVLAALTLADKG